MCLLGGLPLLCVVWSYARNQLGLVVVVVGEGSMSEHRATRVQA